MTVKFTTVPSKRLAETINGSAYSFSLQDIKGWSGSDLTSADFGTEMYASFRNSLGTKLELMKIDPATIASASITILKRGLGFDGDQVTEVSANIQDVWVKGDTIVELGSHVSQLLEETVRKSGNATLSGDLTFSNHAPTIPTEISSETHRAASIEYVNNTAINGAPDAAVSVKGIVKLSTAPVSGTNPIAIGDNDTRVPTQTENDAMQGTSGTPGSSNKYVTNDDTSTTGGVSKVVRTNAYGAAYSTVLNSFYFGNGADGNVTISSNTTLTRDMMYDNLTINTGVTLNPGGYRIFVRGTLTVSGTGKISRDGNNGAVGGQSGTIAGGAALSSGTIGGSSAGGTGAANGAGGAGVALTNCLGSVGGKGSDGTPGGSPGGGAAAGSATAATPTIQAPSFPTVLSALNAANATGVFQGGSGGGGGGGFLSASGSGGTGGGGGGVVMIAAQIMNFAATDSVTAKGGNGGNGSGGGGGGGGGGGVIILVYSAMTGSTLVASSCVSGGTLGTGNSGVVGAAGTQGNLYSYLIS